MKYIGFRAYGTVDEMPEHWQQWYRPTNNRFINALIFWNRRRRAKNMLDYLINKLEQNLSKNEFIVTYHLPEEWIKNCSKPWYQRFDKKYPFK